MRPDRARFREQGVFSPFNPGRAESPNIFGFDLRQAQALAMGLAAAIGAIFGKVV
jgi:hypothetical protein